MSVTGSLSSMTLCSAAFGASVLIFSNSGSSGFASTPFTSSTCVSGIDSSTETFRTSSRSRVIGSDTVVTGGCSADGKEVGSETGITEGSLILDTVVSCRDGSGADKDESSTGTMTCGPISATDSGVDPGDSLFDPIAPPVNRSSTESPPTSPTATRTPLERPSGMRGFSTQNPGNPPSMPALFNPCCPRTGVCAWSSWMRTARCPTRRSARSMVR